MKVTNLPRSFFGNGFKTFAASALAMLVLALSGCGGSGGPSFDELDLTIVHMNDHHSNLDSASGFALTIDGREIETDVGGFPRVVTLMDSYKGRDSVLKLHAGDAVTGTLYHIFSPYEADAAMMNLVCFDAFALGNHEFDDSDAGLSEFLDELGSGDCGTPVLAANVLPQIGTPLAPTAQDDYIQPYVVKEVRGVKVGVIGIDIKQKTQESSRPLDTTTFLDEVSTAQRYIDVLKASGIRHIVLLTHQGYDNDLLMAAQLTDVDVIVGGDSHSLLGDFDEFGLTSSGEYPSVVTNASGSPTCVVQAWENSRVVGELTVRFDRSGNVKSCQGTPKLLVSDAFTDPNNADALITGSDQASLLAYLADKPNIAVVAESTLAAATLAPFTATQATRRAELIGVSNDDFCHIRIPGSSNLSGGIAGCSTINTFARGSDVAQLVNSAFLDASLRADIALQNGGGVRTGLAAGNVTYGTALTILPFSNLLTELSLTGQEIIDTLEEAVANHLDNGGSSGSHPYGAGIRWDLDLTKARGARFSNIEVKDRSTSQWSAIDLTKTYIVVTNSFIAEGRDGYDTFGVAYEEGRFVDTGLLYSQTFVDYLKKNVQSGVSRPARDEYSHKTFVTSGGVTLTP